MSASTIIAGGQYIGREVVVLDGAGGQSCVCYIEKCLDPDGAVDADGNPCYIDVVKGAGGGGDSLGIDAEFLCVVSATDPLDEFWVRFVTDEETGVETITRIDTGATVTVADFVPKSAPITPRIDAELLCVVNAADPTDVYWVRFRTNDITGVETITRLDTGAVVAPTDFVPKPVSASHEEPCENLIEKTGANLDVLIPFVRRWKFNEVTSCYDVLIDHEPCRPDIKYDVLDKDNICTPQEIGDPVQETTDVIQLTGAGSYAIPVDAIGYSFVAISVGAMRPIYTDPEGGILNIPEGFGKERNSPSDSDIPLKLGSSFQTFAGSELIICVDRLIPA